MKRLQILQKLVYEKFHVQIIVAVNLSNIYFLKNAKKTCKPNNPNLTATEKFRKSTSGILQSFKINTSILKVCFKYTSNFEKKYINLANLLPVYFRI